MTIQHTAAAAPPPPSQRWRRILGRTIRRPELGAFGATVFVFIVFGIFAGDSGMFSVAGISNFLEVSAQLGILATFVALLMIGGEFDLSLGSMIGFSAIVIGIGVVQFGLPIWLTVLSPSALPSWWAP